MYPRPPDDDVGTMTRSPATTSPMTDPPVDVTISMMSPATSALLANMSVTIASSTSLGRCPPPSRPPPVNDVADVDDRNRPRRLVGPSEVVYRRDHEKCVSSVVSSYEHRVRTNLRSACASLPDFSRMDDNGRRIALANVDELLARLSKLDAGMTNVETKNTMGGAGGGSLYDDDNDDTTLGVEDDVDDDINGGSILRSRSASLINFTNDEATTLEDDQSASLLIDATTSDGRDDSRVLSVSGRRSTSLLIDESGILLSDDSDDNDEENDDGEIIERHASAEEGIERARNNAASNESLLTPPLPSIRMRRAPSKRLASNSGKRGLRSRHKSIGGHRNDDNCDDGVNDSFLADGSYPHKMEDDGDDSFGMGASPIQRRLSGDPSYDYYSPRPFRDERLLGIWPDAMIPQHHPEKLDKNDGGIKSDRDSGGSSSRFSAVDDDDGGDASFVSKNAHCYNDDYSDHDNADRDDDDSCGVDDGGISIHPSQWDAFRTANAELTSTQLDGDDGGGESPARRRAIRFDCASQRTSSKQPKQTSRFGCDRTGREASILNIRDDDDYEHMQMQLNETAQNIDDDPIQTVRNLSRRAKAMDELGMDSLEEIAPSDIRLRDGVTWKLDPLRCRQEKNRTSLKNNTNSTKTTKAVGVSKRGGSRRTKSGAVYAAAYDVTRDVQCESSELDDSLSDPGLPLRDPILDFPSRVAARLNAGLDFLLEKEARLQPGPENEDCELSSAALLSMSLRQIISVVSKILILNRKSTRMHQRVINGPSSAKRLTPSSNALPKDYDFLAGGTLVVCRGKDDIDQWEVALREYTSLSVLNHAGLQSGLRKLANTAGKCAGFDVVLTTFDSIRNKEATIPVESTGRAILGGSVPSNDDDGWFTSRGVGTQSGPSAPQKCLQLSVLHRLSWFRVIFIDILGQKGFLIKPGTARLQAAVALNSKSRQAFFEKKEEDLPSKAEKKFFDDRKQLRSLITTLHLPDNIKLDQFISSHVLDVSKAGRTKDLELDSSSSESDVSEE